MKKNILHSIVEDSLHSIEQNLSFYLHHHSPEYIHKIRLHVKKIKSVYAFVNKVYSKKYPSPNLSKLFNEAGKIREVQLSLHFFNSLPDTPEECIVRLKKTENILISTFTQKTGRYLKSVRKFQGVVFFPKTLPDKKTIKKFFADQHKKANKELKKKNRKGVHQYRKRLKKIMYVYQLLPKKLQKNISLDTFFTDTLQNKIGQWHDIFSTLSLLSQKQMKKGNEKLLSSLKKEEKQQFKTLSETLSSENKDKINLV